MSRLRLAVLFLLLAAIGALIACGGGSTQSSTNHSQTQGVVYVTGQDAPLPSVVAFQITINSLSLSDGTNTVNAIDQPTTIDFGRLLGLRTLVGLNNVAAGTYTSATVTFSNPVISYLDMTTTPPSVQTMNGTLTSSSIAIPLNPGLTVSANGLGGLGFHFNLHDSIFVDSSGQITGQVTPSIQIHALHLGDDDTLIDELRGGVSSVNASAGTFVLQRPHGRDLTIVTNTDTQWVGSDNINTISPPCIVEVSGHIQADGSLLATGVEVLSRDAFVVGGIILDVSPLTGAANNITMLVSTEVPDVPQITVGSTTTFPVNGETTFDIRSFNLPIETFLFNPSMLVLGQRVAVGGALNSATTPLTLDVRRVVLRRQGVDGQRVAGTVVINNGNSGSFELQNNGMFGYILGGNLKVMTSNVTRFINMSGLTDLTGTDTVRLCVVGLVLKDGSGNPVLVAGRVEKLN
jgi:hypothetical protein